MRTFVEKLTENFIPMPNWVLVSVERDLSTPVVVTDDGIAIDTTWEPEKHAVVCGHVKRVCNHLEYTSPEYMNNSCLSPFGEAPLEFQTEIEIQKGDLVYFNYLSMGKAIREGRIVMDDDGNIFALIRYDRFYAAKRHGKWIGVNGFLLAIRKKQAEQVNDEGVLRSQSRLAENTALVVSVGDPLKENFWDKLQTPQPYYDHGFVEAGDMIVFRQQAGRDLENSVIKTENIEYIRLQEKDVMAKSPGNGRLIPNKGWVIVEPLTNDIFKQILGTARYNMTGRGKVIEGIGKGETVFYNKGAERRILFEGQEFLFVQAKTKILFNSKTIIA